jgi:hypothetical protein
MRHLLPILWLLAAVPCVLGISMSIVSRADAQSEPPNDQSRGMPLVFKDNFERGARRWEVTDENSWDIRKDGDNHVFGLNKRTSDYTPKYRSPHNIALIKDIKLSDFVLIFKVRSTKDTGDHRDACAFFCHQDADNFYYVHLGARPDPASGQIMIVHNAPRAPITDNTKRVPWDDEWHTVKVTRDSHRGTIEVFFDDMDLPLMKAVDKTFGAGRIGIGSFDDMNDFDDVFLYGKNLE